MVEIGRWNYMRVVKLLDFGAYLDGGELGEILMPIRYVAQDCKIDDEVEVFLYLDSEDRLVATTEKPLAQVGDFALLQVVSVSSIGAFLDWGLMKDLFVPFREQKLKMEEGDWYFVHIYVDEMTKRIVGSAKVEEYLDLTPHTFEEGQEVDIVLYTKTDIGYKAVINNTHTGVVYTSDVFREVERGEKIKGYIKQVRDDRKIDLLIDKPGYAKVDEISQKILDKLKEQNGFMPLVDKSPAEDIYDAFGISKKTFKKAIGSLYKARLITIEDKGIKLN